MKISYAITVCNEFIEIQRLVSFLLTHKRKEDEIVILYDENNGDSKIEEYLKINSINKELIWYKDKFNNDFANWKNKLTNLCTGDYIFQIDADEIPHTDLIEYLPQIIEANPEVEVYLVPRVNTVEGLTQAHLDRWRWFINENGWVNYPDYQYRIYKKSDNIIWKNRVHERLTGYIKSANLPAHEDYSLYHPKTIEKQEKQNNYYNTL